MLTPNRGTPETVLIKVVGVAVMAAIQTAPALELVELADQTPDLLAVAVRVAQLVLRALRGRNLYLVKAQVVELVARTAELALLVVLVVGVAVVAALHLTALTLALALLAVLVTAESGLGKEQI